jgi:hypothetical protein
VNSVDYLLKPIEPQQLERALEKVGRLGETASAIDWVCKTHRLRPEAPSRIINSPMLSSFDKKKLDIVDA